MLEKFDPNTIADENLRQIFVYLLNLVEIQATQIKALHQENQALRDEINRLKGEQGRPKIKPNTPPSNLSSEKQRHQPKPYHRGSKHHKIVVDREQTCRIDPASLPRDARFKGYHTVVIQDIVFHTNNVRFKREKYYSPGQQKTYLASLPKGFEGEFGPGVKAWVLDLYFSGGMSEPKIKEVLSQAGLMISSGQISYFITEKQQEFHQESAAVCEAGLHSSPWHHLDDTATRVDGVNHYCHIVCNPLYSVYRTLPHKDRLTVLQVLMGGKPLHYQLDGVAWLYLAEVGLAQKWQIRLSQLPQGEPMSEAELKQIFERELQGLGVQQQRWVKEALAVGWYQSQTDYPVVQLLVCDDAAQFHLVVEELGLCWIHENRHYKKLQPVLAYHKTVLEKVEKALWDYYRALQGYQKAPEPHKAVELEEAFEKLFGQKTGYVALDQRLSLTLEKKTQLLMVLKHPEIALHNNPAELSARQRVRKRDVSFGPRSPAGTAAWDTFQTLAATTKKLGINFFSYLHDRLCQTNLIEPLADIITARAKELNLGASWACSV
jgi:hypothetical protein